jgi:metallo-beta-lactamase family protein
MSNKEDKKVKVSCVGISGLDVTGSAYLIECPTGEKILLDFGMYQTADKYDSYKINNRKLKFKPSELTFVAISHLNIDHIGLVPLLYKRGANCKTYIAYDNIDFISPMLKDCEKIMERDVEGFDRKYGKKHELIYSESDVNNSLSYFMGTEYDKIIEITPNVSIQFIPSGHIYGAAQIILYIKKLSGNIVKIAYSGDLGNILFEQPFVRDFEPVIKTNMFIGECTYNRPERSINKNQREKDIEVIKAVVQETCYDRHGILLIPTFALQRTEIMLNTLYDIYSNDENFNIPIIVDSPLAVSLLDCFGKNLKDENLNKFEKILNWKNLKIIRTVEESKACVEEYCPKIILSSSGMLTQGRSIYYLKKIIQSPYCSILMCGYMAEGTIGWKIKNATKKRTINIDKKAYNINCGIKCLKSFSSHMQYEQLMDYYTNIANNGCEIIWLVHSDEYKLTFKEELKDRISKINKTTKVVATNLDTVGRV